MRKRKSRKRHTSHASHERWLVSYADFITLLFAFFVVLYASSQQDSKKMTQLAAAIHGAFQQLGAFTGVEKNAPPPGGGLSAEDMKKLAAMQQGEGADPLKSGGVDVAQLRRELEGALGEELKKHEIVTNVTAEGFVISLKEMGFFESGDAHLMPGAVEKLTRIAAILNKHGFEIRVEGHTDNMPIHTAAYNSNWELSTARATEVVLLLVNNDGFDSSKISVAGYGEFRPIASNDTPEGRKTNRRVDLVVVSQRSVDMQPVRTANALPPSKTP